jgi:hypothetical protein
MIASTTQAMIASTMHKLACSDSALQYIGSQLQRFNASAHQRFNIMHAALQRTQHTIAYVLFQRDCSCIWLWMVEQISYGHIKQLDTKTQHNKTTYPKRLNQKQGKTSIVF